MNTWREDRERWREERRKWRNERRKHFGEWGVHYQSGHGRIWTGMLLLIIGVFALLKVTNTVIFPVWFFTWPMLLIAIGFFMGIKHGFRGGAWFIIMLIGGAFLAERIDPTFTVRQYIWPFVLILLGMFFILRPRRRRWYFGEQKDDEEKKNSGPGVTPVSPASENFSAEDVIDTTSIFGGVKKNILSKNFRGGDIVNIFGGAEIDLSQSDINGTVRLEMTQVFGGTKLIVPSNWQVKTEMAAIFGGVEDKRSVRDTAQDPNKVLVLAGTSIFAGIEIRSY